jgi:hypothetical protein
MAGNPKVLEAAEKDIKRHTDWFILYITPKTQSKNSMNDPQSSYTDKIKYVAQT